MVPNFNICPALLNILLLLIRMLCQEESVLSEVDGFFYIFSVSFPDQGTVDSSMFANMPPLKCVNGTDSAPFRTNCDNEGHPLSKRAKSVVTQEDKWRAETKTPRHDYR